ncbi:hypothetical protein GIY30_01620 [Gordonia sp. HNM0687]|uniref:DUF1795 domain-containing protein n=1 Tax=Gordonia mangrovi TaxID=2665643 RepID=A0A6L7GKZ6_9ACTN|nr:hypothetical protein [Gordonia mangrovi]MXP20067.1 hypothetical protein [Gordonia mangrovi]UVF79322.1 hypothetical protein NWF22_05630 [Gordonia mangrovi]
MDSRTLVPGFVVLAIALILSFVPAMINASVDYDDPVVAGDVMAVGDRVTFTPTVGWNITGGLRESQPLPGGEYPPVATVADSGIVLQIRTAPFDGTPEELLDQIRDNNADLGDLAPDIGQKAASITTTDGHRGVIADYQVPTGEGVVAAFVDDGLGVEVVAAVPPEYERESAEDIARMIQSITIGEASE